MAATSLPSGASYAVDVIDVKREKDLLAFINRKDALWKIATGNRRVQQYGFEYDYKTRKIATTPTPAIPPSIADLITELKLEGINQVIINEYTPGQGITAHIDHPKWFGEKIVSVSLGSGASMVLRCGPTVYEQYLEPRSAIFLAGVARHKYTHEIPCRKSDTVGSVQVPRGTRVSITLRTVIAQ